MGTNYFTDYLKLIVGIYVKVGLQTLFSNCLSLHIFNFNKNLEWVSFKKHQLIPKIIWMIIDRYPDTHGVSLLLAVSDVKI